MITLRDGRVDTDETRVTVVGFQFSVKRFLMKKIRGLIIFLMTIPLFGIADAEFRVGGYYKNFSTVFNSPVPEAPMSGIVVNRLRLNLSYVPMDTLSFAFAYDFTPRVQDPLLFSQSLIAVGTPLVKLSDCRF